MFLLDIQIVWVVPVCMHAYVMVMICVGSRAHLPHSTAVWIVWRSVTDWPILKAAQKAN